MTNVVLHQPGRPENIGIMVDGVDAMLLEDYRRWHTPLDVKLSVPGHGQPVSVTCFIFKQTVAGAWALWDLDDAAEVEECKVC